VNLRRDVELTKPFAENGLGHHLCLFVLDCRDERVLGESVRDEQNVFVLAVSGQHWAEKVSMDSDIWSLRIW